ncbi:MAG: ABC transporter permease [Bdellovibrionales bacterium]|jgi:macrolide transport system ATP-binding/permease protein|nr:ABC transporter permease [Bdellovibrionales bacterium]
MIEVRGLSKVYTMGEHEVHALRDVSLSIEPGDFVAIMGPSGSGKSTLMQILGLLDTPTGGSYKIEGHEVAGLTDDQLAVLRRETVGFIFQQFHLLARMSAKENVALPLFYSGRYADTEQDIPQDLLEKVGLGTRTGHRPNEMSGGQQQRVAIARALVNSPRIVFADEPTGNLDSKSEQEIMAILRDLNAQGITVVLVTHEDEIGKQAKRLIRMRDGQIQTDERLRPIQDKAPHATTRANTKGSTEPTKKQASSAPLSLHMQQGFRTLWANKVRTSLSVLGILIGVAAVVVMLALGKGAQSAIESQLSSLGSNLLVLRAGAPRMGGVAQESGSTAKLEPEDALAIQEEVPDIRYVAPSLSGRAQISYGNRNWNTQVTGTTTEYETMKSSTPIIGRFFTDEENSKRMRVALLGATVVRELFGTANPIGEMVRVNRTSFQVIGVLPEKGASGWRDQDDIIVVPLSTAMYRLLGKTNVDSIDIEMLPGRDSKTIETNVMNLMNRRHNVRDEHLEEAFSIRNMADLQAALSQSTQTMSLLLASIAGISLLVGGIGIMNIMLVSVTERTREIGLRKAVGAQRRDILLQFLTESLMVSAIGGIAGVIIGVSAILILQTFTGWTMSIAPMSILMSFSFSATIGVVFGLYPARKASFLNPIVALRHD